MQDIYFLDKEFNSDNSKNYNLSIQVSLNGFSFSIYEPQTGRHIGIRNESWEDIHKDNFNTKLKERITSEPLFKYEYRKTILLFVSKEKTIIPGEYFQQENIMQLYSPCENISNADILLYNNIESLKSYIIFSIEKDIYHFINTHFNNPNIIHHCVPLLQFAMKSNNSLHPNIYINIMKEYFDIIVIVDNKAKLINTHTYNSDIDIAYYVLNALKGLNISLNTCKCILSGIVNVESEAITILKQYIKYIDYSNTYGDIKFLKKHNIDIAYFANLLNVETCVL